MKVIVCGSIGFGGLEKIREVQRALKEAGILVYDHISEENMDYSQIDDFRDKFNLAKTIVEHDLKYVDKCDVVVILADRPSFGTAMEMYYAYQKNKVIITYAANKLPTPWPVYFSHYIAKSLNTLIRVLRNRDFEFIWGFLKAYARRSKVIYTLSKKVENEIKSVTEDKIIVLSKEGKGILREIYKQDFKFAWDKFIKSDLLTLDDLSPELHGRKAIVMAFLATLPFVEVLSTPKLGLQFR